MRCKLLNSISIRLRLTHGDTVFNTSRSYIATVIELCTYDVQNIDQSVFH